MPEDRISALETVYRERIAPILLRHGFQPSERSGRPAAPGFYTQLLETTSPSAFLIQRQRLRDDPEWQALLSFLEKQYGLIRVSEIIRYDYLALCIAPATKKRIGPSGAGKRVPIDQGKGYWRTYDVTDGLAGNGENFQTYTTKNGLAHNEIRAIYQDASGKFWFGTSGGLNQCADISVPNPIFQTLTEADGLGSSEIQCILQDRTGVFWFGSTNGLTRFAPPPASPPPAVIKTVIADKHYDAQSAISLSSSTDLLAIEFGAVSFKTRPEGLVFRYRLNGYDQTRQTTKNPRVEYQDLPIGDYAFEVQAIDRDLAVSAVPATLKLRIHLPYAQMALGLALFGAVGFIFWQAQRLVQRDRRLRTSIQNLEKEIAERTRLDMQLRDINYLYDLRVALGSVRTPMGVVQTAGHAIARVIESQARISISLDDNNRIFGEAKNGDLTHQYERILSWGDRTRGQIQIGMDTQLTEAQERILLDETASQLSRTLEALELQMQLLQSARLVSLGQMAAGVAHELNQPLGGISATAEDYYLRLQDGIPISSDQFQDMFKRILGMVDRMNSTVEHLRVFSRDTTQDPGELLDLNDIVHSSLDIIGTQLQNHGIDVRCNLAKNLPSIYGQPYQLEQILLNLLGNARDALDARKTEPPFIKGIEIRTRSGHRSVVVEVEDNGDGIAPEHLDHIFDPFYTTKPVDKGTGLGLSITYAIVKNHGGDITCQSREGKGTCFRVSLPFVT